MRFVLDYLYVYIWSVNMTRHAFLIFVALLVLPVPRALAGMELLMFEQPGCIYCARWDAEIAPAYPKTDEGKAAPLHRLDLHDDLPEGYQIKLRPAFTPTFVLTVDGVETGRIEGYPGEDFFWALLDGLIQGATGKTAN